MTGTEMEMGGGISLLLLFLALFFVALWLALPVVLFATRALLREILYELRRFNEAVGAPHLDKPKKRRKSDPGRPPGKDEQ